MSRTTALFSTNCIDRWNIKIVYEINVKREDYWERKLNAMSRLKILHEPMHYISICSFFHVN